MDSIFIARFKVRIRFRKVKDDADIVLGENFSTKEWFDSKYAEEWGGKDDLALTPARDCV